jgi:nucleotide-binding universal stress UspA family protein
MEGTVIKHILVPETSLGFDANLLEDAFKLARPFSAHVDVLHVRWEPRLDLPFYGQGFPLQMLDSVIREAEQSAQAASLAARNMFEKVSAAASVPVTASSSEDGHVTAEWREIAGPAARIIGAEARTADLTVLSRLSGKFSDLEILEGALLESGRPVLLRGGDMAGVSASIVIAWDGSLAAARAVAFAQDFITRADMVTILVVEDDAEDAPTTAAAGRPHPRSEHLVKHLAWHGIDAFVLAVKREGRSVGEALAATAVEMKASLLVMGGYGHSRLREIVLGGATRHMLNHPIDCPVLLAH